jgi:hypothetical protein
MRHRYVPRPSDIGTFSVASFDCARQVIETSKRDKLSGEELIAHVYYFAVMWDRLDRGIAIEYPGSDLPVQILVQRECVATEGKTHEV